MADTMRGYGGIRHSERGVIVTEELLLQMNEIHKSFPGVHALKGVNFELRTGEVHAILGENGAGKSTLIKILGGIYIKDQGEIYIQGRKQEINNTDQARTLGISIIHQELVLVPYLTVAENIFLGREPHKGLFLNREKVVNETRNYLKEFGLKINPNKMMAELNIAQQQMIEIVKAISFNSSIVIMDEPTSSLSDKEVEALFLSIRKLTAKGIGIIYISHRMSELQQIADRVTVMRDGEYVGTRNVKETSNDELITMMVGRKVDNYYTRTFNECKKVRLKVKDLCNDKIHNVSFEAKEGEILGFAGLIGAGRSETMQAIFGIDHIERGKITLEGEEIQGKTSYQILQTGISLVPEDRRAEGIFPGQNLKFNLTLKVLRQFMHGISVDSTKETEIAMKYFEELSVRAPGLDTKISSLSGGNQQKVIIGSWLASKPKVMILDEPTRGIDVGAKSEIYTIMNNLAKQGVTIIMVSSELPELLNMSDRIVVMCDGTITKILDRKEASQEKIMQYAVKL